MVVDVIDQGIKKSNTWLMVFENDKQQELRVVIDKD